MRFDVASLSACECGQRIFEVESVCRTDPRRGMLYTASNRSPTFLSSTGRYTSEYGPHGLPHGARPKLTSKSFAPV
jgi:hypothetical protein